MLQMKKYNLKIIFIYFVCICGGVHATVHMWRSEDNLWECLSFYHVEVPGIEFRLSGLEAASVHAC